MKDISAEDITSVMDNAWKAFLVYRKLSLKRRADFMRAIATGLSNSGDSLIEIAAKETNLPEARLKNERTRTIFQLTSYAAACEKGEWLEIRIDTAISDRNPPKPDLRKMLVPLGPVVVFGASNFPFAYSTAGGDTACAFAAGCPVIVKAHPAHPATSRFVADIISRAAADCYLPAGIFTHIESTTNAAGEALVKHYYTKAVGFTGSFAGGKQLFDWGSQRKEPIPVFAEMGSVNPVFLLPGKMSEAHEEIAKQFAGSITLGAGQFCTNPGLIIGIDNTDLENFLQTLGKEIESSKPMPMLSAGIYKNYVERRAAALSQRDVMQRAVSTEDAGFNMATPTIAVVSASEFIKNALLHKEVFGPYSLIIKCRDNAEMIDVAMHLEGQLTTTIMATEKDVKENEELVESLKNICGRFIMNNVPTGVEVCMAMHHGGPYPATTDSRFTSVGADGIKRFARPMCFQNWPDSLLPDELKNHNPLNIWRTIDGDLSNRKLF